MANGHNNLKSFRDVRRDLNRILKQKRGIEADSGADDEEASNKTIAVIGDTFFSFSYVLRTMATDKGVSECMI